MKNIKKLPKIYQNEIDKEIRNNKNLCKVEEVDSRKMNNIEVNEFIDNLFNTTGYAFNIPVIIKTNNNIYDTSVIIKKNGYLLTIDRDKINIDNIISIKKKNP